MFMCFSSYKKMPVEAIMNHCSIINNSKETNFQTLKLKKKAKEKTKNTIIKKSNNPQFCKN